MTFKDRKTAFFDFDGVIADSFSAAFSVSKMIHPLLEEKDYRRRFDGNIHEAWDDDRAKNDYKPEIDFFKEFEPLLLKSPLFPGIKEALDKIMVGRSLIIVSSTTSDLVEKYLQLYGIKEYFIEIMGNDIHKSKIKKLEMALAKYGNAPDDCIFVTDTLGDIKEAQHVGIESIAVTWGYQTREILEEGNPVAIVDTVEELLGEFV